LDQFALEFDLTPQRKIFSVSELNSAIRAVLDEEFQDISVAGEISGLKLAASGHYYFTLKERDAQVKCVAFRSAHRYWKFKPQDGLAVLARGRIDVYEARGEYQLLVESLEPQGFGALQLAFEQLKQKLAAEGLFDPARKRPLPRFPRRIGIVTSPRGAAIADMVHILSRRFPGIHVRLYPSLVQGEGAVEEVVRGIEYFSRTQWPDLVIVGRGGGSLEDLWTFNEEAVARAIAACTVPVISAVGHETDVTIADFVADLRAPTPSAAAELAVPNLEDIVDRIEAARAKATQGLRYRIAMLERRLRQQGIDRALGVLHRNVGRHLQRIDEQEYRLRERVRTAIDLRERERRGLEERLRQQGIDRALGVLHRNVGRHLQRIDEQEYRLRERVRTAIDLRERERRGLEERLRHFDVRPRLAADRRRMDSAHTAMLETVRRRLALRRSDWEQARAKIEQLSPLKILERGYAIVSNEGGILKDAKSAPVGSSIHVRVAKGELDARVDK
jgi:exodeoxyribonuclease VII large subunit